MDDLSGLDWQASSKPRNTRNTAPASAATFASNYSSFRPSPAPPTSGVTSPLSLSRPFSILNSAKPPAKSPSPANDTFGSLLSLKPQKGPSNLTLQDRQKQLLEEKQRQQAQQAQLWDTLGSGRGTPEVRVPSPAVSNGKARADDEDDLLAAFKSSAPVDNASFYPPPASGQVSGRSTPAVQSQAVKEPATAALGGFDEDDDPFGLGRVKPQSNGHVTVPVSTQADDDDILGDLGKPVTARAPPRTQVDDALDLDKDERDSSPEPKDEPQDKAVAELVDMGFPLDTSKIALAETDGSVQAAVGWLLQQAHEESKQKAKGQSTQRRRSPIANSRSPPRNNSQRRQPQDRDAVPPWMREEARSSSAPRRQDSRSPANGEKDVTQVASELSNKLFKSANSLWKSSQKQMAKTLADFQQEGDTSQPKWMREASAESSRASSQRRPDERPVPKLTPKFVANATDEAAMLDMPRDDVLPPKPQRQTNPSRQSQLDLPSRGRSPAEPLPGRNSPQPKFMQQQPQQDKRPATKLSRQEVDEQASQAYVSPARRKRPTPKPESAPEPEVDLFGPAPSNPVQSSTNSASISRTSQAPQASRPTPVPVRPKAPPRNIPSISPSALSTSSRHRKAGTEAFKRGDYAAAHESYSAALTPIPSTHPVIIVLLCNRALTAIKTGDPKVAVSDADRALEVIGASRGEGETIELGSCEGIKDMKEFYGKAVMRKAEALEHMEKWTDAAKAWRQAIEVGAGGAVSLRGRDRCEKASAGDSAVTATRSAPVKNAVATPSKAAPPAKGMGNTMSRPALTTASDAEAVKRLRQQNAAAEKADDEKFALTDQVDARLTAWKGGKADNLRALLQSLDNVLWPEAGWKKVGMSDLVMPNKVKVIYMKAIAKVHPDKVCN